MKPVRLILGVLAAALLAPATASATVTTSQITNLPNPAYVTYDDNSDTGAAVNRVTVSGVTNGTAGDYVSIAYRSTDVATTSYSSYRDNVPVAADGTFKTTIDLDQANYDTYYLSAVPKGFTAAANADFAPFKATTFVVDGVERYFSNQVPYRYYYGQYSTTAYLDVNNWDRCGLSYTQLFDIDDDNYAAQLWGCANTMRSDYDDITLPDASVRAGMTVDGAAVYGPNLADTSLPGAPEVEYSFSRDIASGQVKMNEESPLVKCVPSDAACTSYAKTGVTIVREIMTAGSAQEVRFTDWYRSTDAANHSFDVLLENNADGTGAGPSWKFGGGSFATHATNDSIPTTGWAKGWNGIIKRDPASDDATSSDIDKPYGAFAYSEVPSNAWYASQNSLFINYTGVATASTSGWPLRGAFSIYKTHAEAAASAARLSDWTVAPTVAFTAPTSGATLPIGNVTVTGTAADNVGVASVKVNGVAAVLTGGSWSVSLPVSGATKFTAVAADAQGNTTSAELSVTGVDKAAPVVKITKLAKFYSLAAALKSGLPLTFTTTEPGKASVKATMPAKAFKGIGGKAKAAKPIVIGTSKVVTFTKAGKQKVVLVLNKAAKKKLAKLRKPVKITLTFTITDTSGNTTTKTSVATLKFVKAKKKK